MHPQFQQLANLFLLLILGTYSGHIYLSWLNITIVLASTLFTEHTLLYLKNKKLSYFSYSALSTAIGVILMMASPHLWVYIFLISLGLLQKHFLVISVNHKKRHFFNPSNFALLMGLTFFYKESHIILGQLGDDLWLEIIVGLLAIVMLLRVDRWIIPLVFTSSYLLFQYYLFIQYDPVMIFEDLYHRFQSVSLIVFIFFMLTDPKTTPEKHHHQLFFALFIALLATCLDIFNGFRVQHLFLSLSVFSIFIPAIEIVADKDKNKTMISTTLILLLLITMIFLIELKPPYYFAMED